MISKELARHFNRPASRRGSTSSPRHNNPPSSPNHTTFVVNAEEGGTGSAAAHAHHLNVMATKSSSQHMLAFYLFEVPAWIRLFFLTGNWRYDWLVTLSSNLNFHQVCLALKDFYQLREDMLPLERKSLEMRPHFQDWFAPVFHTWIGVVAERVGRTNVFTPVSLWLTPFLSQTFLCSSFPSESSGPWTFKNRSRTQTSPRWFTPPPPTRSAMPSSTWKTSGDNSAGVRLPIRGRFSRQWLM